MKDKRDDATTKEEDSNAGSVCILEGGRVVDEPHSSG